MVYNWQQLEMKKSIFIIASLAAVVLLSSFVIERNVNNNTVVKQTIAAEGDCMGEPEAYVSDIDRSQIKDGVIKVKVRVKNYEKDVKYRIKVTPVSQITGLVVEGSLFTSVCNGSCGGAYYDLSEGEVTFHCYSGKEGDAQYCKAYDFQARIVN